MKRIGIAVAFLTILLVVGRYEPAQRCHKRVARWVSRRVRGGLGPTVRVHPVGGHHELHFYERQLRNILDSLFQVQQAARVPQKDRQTIYRRHKGVHGSV